MKINIEKVNKKDISSLEQLNIGPGQIGSIALIAAGLKPATEVGIFPWNDSIETVEAVINGLGMAAEVVEIRGNETVLAVAKNTEVLEQLKKVLEYKNKLIQEGVELDEKYHREYGRLMGFPESAINAFCLKSQELIYNENYPDDIAYMYPTFILSKNGYDEQVALLREWKSALEKNVPNSFRLSQPIEDK